MSRWVFEAMKLIVKKADLQVLKEVLPKGLHEKFDAARTRRPVIEDGDVLPFALGNDESLTWAVWYCPDTVVLYVVPNEESLTLQQVRDFENKHHLRGHAKIQFLPIPKGNFHSDSARNFIQRNVDEGRNWDEGLR
ncbi:MAG TPA: hypothetical protein VD907_00470 [Verrucomicrobiae bacterium]|nr:hypothetical protein [Verrucomicrobiae bacterium]